MTSSDDDALSVLRQAANESMVGGIRMDGLSEAIEETLQRRERRRGDDGDELGAGAS